MVDLSIRIFDSSVKHIKGREESLDSGHNNIEVAKEEYFAFQILIEGETPFFCTLGKNKDIHWSGLGDKIRMDISGHNGILDMNFLGYVKNDDGSMVGDPILKGQSMYIEENQMIWIGGKIPRDFLGDHLKLEVKVYYSKGYEREELVKKENIRIEVLDYVVKSAKEGDFYLDLWQHPCSWARAYDVEYFSDEHFEIIDNYIEGLSKLGQRVIDLIVSDYPWAGQRCFEFEKNASNLFEFNMVKVTKNIEGKICCDFKALDRYIDVCMKHGIDEEINIFGILGNWDAYLFGNPIDGYKDAIRISYYDEKYERFDFIRTINELKDYLSILFNHLIDKGLWDRVRIMCDQPNNVEVFKECTSFIESTIANYKVNFKAAIDDQEFFEQYGENIQSISLNTCELVNNIEKLSETKSKILDRKGRFTWYSCRFPEDLNIFLKSPLIESRLKGWFTYYWGFEGFLRWAYAIWTTNPLEDIRYKYPKWSAGDMLLVYPGKDLKPMSSVREKNLLFGIQDFNIFKDLEKNKIARNELLEKMQILLGKKEEMKFRPEKNVELSYSLNSKEYSKLRNTMIKKFLI